MIAYSDLKVANKKMIELELMKTKQNMLEEVIRTDSLQIDLYKYQIDESKRSIKEYSDLCNKLETDNTKIGNQRNIFIATTILASVLSLFLIITK